MRVRRPVHVFAGSSLAAALVVAAGCVGPDPQSAATSSAIAVEHPNDVALLAPRVYTEPDETLAGYAVPDVGGCTGEMIGPNLMMTASHCGDQDRVATFYTYQNQDPFRRVSESFQCHVLLNTFWRTDITLHYCSANPTGENPGDKYGYLDFDLSAPTMGQPVYSFWYNPVDSLGIGWGELFSRGSVILTNVVVWGPEADETPMNSPIGIGFDLWSQPGCSGSAVLNAANHRIIAGPTSTGQGDAAGRYMQSTKTDFEQATVDGFDGGNPVTHYTGIHNDNISALGVPVLDLGGLPRWGGKLDKDGNHLFDIQEAIEHVQGENRRDWYYLGFESERRNALWSTDGTATFNPAGHQAHLSVPAGASHRKVLWHPLLPLDAEASYRVSVMVNVGSAGSATGLHVALVDGGDHEQSGADIATSAGGGWQLLTFGLDAHSAHSGLAFYATGALEVDLSAVSIVREGAVMDFDSGDKRFNWRNDNTGGRALILPDGETSASTPNWAGYVLPTAGRAANTDWPLRNRQLALVANTTYQLCFDVRAAGVPAVGDVASRAARVLSAGAEVARASFSPTTSWSHVCTASFIPPTSDNNLQIGFAGAATTGYFVDNITITRQPCGAVANGCGLHNQCVNGGCVCVPDADACDNLECGSVSDGCGGHAFCGTCDFGSCKNNHCVACAPRVCPKNWHQDPVRCVCVIGILQP